MQTTENSFKNIFTQPLVHFLLIGFLIFALSAWRGNEEVPRNENILVSISDVERLASLWQQTWKRQPTEEELQALVRDHIKEEVYYREALALGLDINDTVIRRRLRQKMEFISQDKAELILPSQDELEDFYHQNKQNYADGDLFDFQQIYFKPGSSINLQEILTALNTHSKKEAWINSVGDSISLPRKMQQANQTSIEKVFGKVFYTSINTLETGQWLGPIESGFGNHLVFIKGKVAAPKKEFLQVLDELKRDWRSKQAQSSLQNDYEILRSKYNITIESPDL